MPWREELTKLPAKLAFGVYRTDKRERLLSARPLPPVKRAMDEVVTLLQDLGHDIIEWDPPSHARAIEVALEAWTADGGIDIYRAINLSGEPLMGRVKAFYGDGPKPAMTGDKVHETNLKHRQYQKDYMDYWNSTASKTSTGRPVDAILCPVAPSPAFQLEKTASICTYI